MTRTGLLLVNLGTPASPSTGDVRRYLREFLSDPLVIDIPAPARWLLLNLVILPFRPRTSAAAYQKVWTERGSPLLFHGLDLRDGVAESLGDEFVVSLAMRYGEPSIRAAVNELAHAGVDRWVVLPLFPQYSTAATRSAVEAVERELARASAEAPVEVVGTFYDDPGFVASFAEVIGRTLADVRSDHVLFSYHGLPERQIRAVDASGSHCLESDGCCEALLAVNRDCYRAQCFATTRALGDRLALAAGTYSTSFQSRLGRTPWIRPYTDLVLPELAERGVRRLAVVCPAFVADCLETIEEIGIRARDQWRELGGESLVLVPSLNAEPAWVRAVAEIARRHAGAGHAPR